MHMYCFIKKEKSRTFREDRGGACLDVVDNGRAGLGHKAHAHVCGCSMLDLGFSV